jgi:methylmalonyl-CoA mutase N-terminal domain/subunit
MKGKVEDAAFRINQSIESGERVVVGVNRFKADEEEPMEIQELDPELRRRQIERLEKVRDERDSAAVDTSLKSLRSAAEGSDNLLYPMKDALAAYATLGEVSDVLRRVFGEYQPRAGV